MCGKKKSKETICGGMEGGIMPFTSKMLPSLSGLKKKSLPSQRICSDPKLKGKSYTCLYRTLT